MPVVAFATGPAGPQVGTTLTLLSAMPAEILRNCRTGTAVLLERPSQGASELVSPKGGTKAWSKTLRRRTHCCGQLDTLHAARCFRLITMLT